MNRAMTVVLAVAIAGCRGLAAEPVAGADASELLLKAGDRLAICGDSITEQKKYSRIIETYLTACMPDLNVEVRQFGWSGETAEGFLRRITNDCLRFRPTVATTCYGMNDYRYRPYDPTNAAWYGSNYTAVAQAFQAAGARVIVGSAGCVGKVASWVKAATGTVGEHNAHLGALRDVARGIAERKHARFADVYGAMTAAVEVARARFGPDFAVPGQDGVHPGWAGQVVMAYTFLRALGLDGDLGRIEVDFAAGKAQASGGHAVNAFDGATLRLESRRYPFCVTGAAEGDDSIRAGMELVPFARDLNRLTLVVRGAPPAGLRVRWGDEARVYTAAELARGVNLAADFAANPFVAAFARVDEAVAAKQAFETTQIKKLFRSPEAGTNLVAVVERTEAERATRVRAILDARTPVMHTLVLEPADGP